MFSCLGPGRGLRGSGGEGVALADQIRVAGPIQDPVCWLISRGLPQRQECGDVRCDDQTLLDSGRSCPGARTGRPTAVPSAERSQPRPTPRCPEPRR